MVESQSVPDDVDEIEEHVEIAEKASTKRPLKKRKKVVERNDEDNLLNQACLALQQTEDEDDVYGRSIAFTMRRITNPRNKAFAKMKIQEILFEAEFGQLGPFPPNVTNQNFPQHQVMSYPLMFHLTHFNVKVKALPICHHLYQKNHSSIYR